MSPQHVCDYTVKLGLISLFGAGCSKVFTHFSRIMHKCFAFLKFAGILLHLILSMNRNLNYAE